MREAASRAKVFLAERSSEYGEVGRGNEGRQRE